jgi:hypothetical protein
MGHHAPLVLTAISCIAVGLLALRFVRADNPAALQGSAA